MKDGGRKIELSINVAVIAILFVSLMSGWVFLEYLALAIVLFTVVITILWNYGVQKAIVSDMTDDEEGLERFISSGAPEEMLRERELNDFIPSLIDLTVVILLFSNGWHFVGGMLLTATLLNVMSVLSQPSTRNEQERDQDDNDSE